MLIDRSLFLDRGYLVIPDVVPPDLCHAVIEAIREAAGVDPGDEATWYDRDFSGHGIVPLHHHQALWNVRQHPRVHEVFSILYGSEELWVSMDRVSYKPPASSRTKGWKPAPMHWDCDPWQLDGLSIQGLVYLTDTGPDQGAFVCAPAVYAGIDTYRDRHGQDPSRRIPVYRDSDLVSVSGPAGSLVVFHRLMPHTSGINLSGNHRYVQYVTMEPEGDETGRRERVRNWREKTPPDWAVRQQIAGQEIPEPGEPAGLTELGKKLVGVVRWNERGSQGKKEGACHGIET